MAVFRIVGVIPARYGSTRLPGKMLADVGGRPLVWHTWRSASRSRRLAEVVVAADDRRIVGAMERLGVPCLLTPKRCASGTERVAWVARRMEADAFVNIQGDEPFMPAENIDLVCAELERRRVGVVTLCVPFRTEAEAAEPSNVKVVFDRAGRALYFSRSLVPFDRDGRGRVRRYKHLGLYGYDRRTLLSLGRLGGSWLEDAERLEQLRWLEYGVPVVVLRARRGSVGVDTPEDLERVRGMLAKA